MSATPVPNCFGLTRDDSAYENSANLFAPVVGLHVMQGIVGTCRARIGIAQMVGCYSLFIDTYLEKRIAI